MRQFLALVPSTTFRTTLLAFLIPIVLEIAATIAAQSLIMTLHQRPRSAYGGISEIYYIFTGGMRGVVSTLIATSTGSQLTHVGIVVKTTSQHVLSSGVVVPPGCYVVHATNDTYERSIGSVKNGVVLTPISDIYRHYQGGIQLRLWPIVSYDYRLFWDWVDEHLGDNYGKWLMVHPLTVLSGHYPEHYPVCSTLVHSWLVHVGAFRYNDYESPGGLYEKMVVSGLFHTDQQQPPSMPLGGLQLVLVCCVVLLLVILVSNWYQPTNNRRYR